MLSILDTRGNPALQTVYCHDNELSALDISHNPDLNQLVCEYNRLKREALLALFFALPNRSDKYAGLIQYEANPGAIRLLEKDRSALKSKNWR